MYRRHRTSGLGEPGEGDYRQLCAGILKQALTDWWAVQKETPCQNQLMVAERLGFSRSAPGSVEELATFFDSDWIDYLCLAGDWAVDSVLEAARRGPPEGGGEAQCLKDTKS